MDRKLTNPKELPWEKTQFRELARLSWPIAISTLSYSVMTLVDTLLVGRLGSAQLAGVGLGGTLAFALLCFPLGLIRGSKTLVSQAVGADRRDELTAYLGGTLLYAVGLGLVGSVAGRLGGPLIARLSASHAAGEFACTYLSIRLYGAPITLLHSALKELRYGQGDARSPMVATVLANVVNIALACLLVFGLHRGVAGAAWATVLAQLVEAGVLGAACFRRGDRFGLPHARHLRALWRVGLPTALQFMLEVGSFSLLATMVAAMSEQQMAAHQITVQVIHFSFLPAFAVSEAASVLAGQAVGADRDELVLPVARQALALVAAYTGCGTLVFAFGADRLAAAFTDDVTLQAVTVRLIHLAAVFQVFDGANMVARAVLRGAGDVRFAAVVGVAIAWAMTPPLTWLLGLRMGLGARGGWLGLSGEIILGALILWWRLERRHWLRAAASSRAELASPVQGAPAATNVTPAQLSLG
jgi:MATE family multidrug resistance protein